MLSAPLATLTRGVIIACGVYNLLLFPDVPTTASTLHGLSHFVLPLGWAMAAIAACIAVRRPVWVLFCSHYTFWVKATAGQLTGLPAA